MALTKGLETFDLKNTSEINVKDFGATGDGVTDDTAAILFCIENYLNVYFPTGTYIMTETIDLTSYGRNDMQWRGDGSTTSILSFTNTALTSLVENIDQQYARWYVTGLSFSGFGATVGSCHGIYSQRTALNSISANLRFKDVAVLNVSGNGFVVTDWFQQTWDGCYARYVGRNGFILGGDQHINFKCSGNYNLECGEFAWWFVGGAPVLESMNMAAGSTGALKTGSGLKLGSKAADADFPTANFCYPTILGLNIETLQDVDAVGIYVTLGSVIRYGTGISIYSQSVAVNYGIYFENLRGQGIYSGQFVFVNDGGGTFVNEIYVASTDGVNGGLTIYGPQANVAYVNGSSITSEDSIHIVTASGNGRIYNKNIVCDGGLTVSNLLKKTNYRTITASENIRRDTGTQGDHIILCDATAGAIALSFDFASYQPFREYVIKKTDVSANAVTVSANNPIEGASQILAAQYDTITIWSDSTAWYIIAKNVA